MSDLFEQLKAIVGPKGFSTDPAEIAPHLTEWRSKYEGSSPLLLKPASTQEVSAILALCHKAGAAVVPQGGNTGLVGAQIPFHNEILLSLSRMNQIRSLDKHDASLIAEAGVVLSTAQSHADEVGLLLAPSLASEGSAMIGGLISSNAGGVNVLRYGMMREQVLGLEVVLANGHVLNTLRTLRKDNTGYDLKQLFIGAEGTLGIITAAALRLVPKPSERATAFVAVPDVNAATALLARLQESTNGLLNAFEVLARSGLELVLAHIAGAKDPFAAPAPWYVLCEASGIKGVSEAFLSGLESALEDGIAADVVIASSEAQRESLWRLRETMSEAQKLEGPSLKHDISVPVSAAARFIETAIAAVAARLPEARPVPFGHLGDGNLHFNFQMAKGTDPKHYLAHWDEIQQIVHDIVHEFGGSFSAEHGVGIMKRDALARYKTVQEVELMRTLKRALDPKSILNPGKLIPD
ncbi:FAD/FMN-containing dehydrogenase [Rhizomicrobium palustre]|uniref:FAD/FMN-containing dehydrogenase n=1 Tax=Rhizomicrobium palustre TaxID=189966 RepID=A0A846N2V3_9PROT|nr:FAD-binding oxidoreductase [Rhizomicrobium palustre]NIK90066.1 FAD/FMN-containing dehydrogenase [Rhizomicrobium palustre]